MKANEHQRRIGFHIHAYTTALLEALDNVLELEKMGIHAPELTVHGDPTTKKIFLGPDTSGSRNNTRVIWLGKS